MVGFLKRATGTSGLPNQFDTGPDSDWVSSVGGNHGHRAFYAQSNNPGSRRTRLTVAIHSDDRHLDPGTGEFVTVVLRRFTCHAPPRGWVQRRPLLRAPSLKFHIVHPPPLDSAGV